MSQEALIFKPGDEVYVAMEPFTVKSITDEGVLNLISPLGGITMSVNPEGVAVIKKTYTTEEVSIKLKESYDRLIKYGGDLVDRQEISAHYIKSWIKACKEGRSHKYIQSALSDIHSFEDAAIKYLTRLKGTTVRGVKILKNTNEVK